jgi:hypothetical protein
LSLGVEASLTSTTSFMGRVVPLKGIPTFKLSVNKEGVPLKGIPTFKLSVNKEGDMVRVERRSGKERRSGRDRRKRSTKGFGGSGRPDSRERRSGKDRRKNPPPKA